jgi:Ca2+-binding RTX toxin-like protein
LSAILVLVLGAAAVAAIFHGDGTFIGTNGNDTFNLGQGNDTAYGLLGKDTINAGNGNDLLDGDGTCMQGNQNGQYCQDGPQQGDQGDIINAGNGNDTLYGGGGKNTINAGTGMDVIHGGLLSDTINVSGGNSADTIYLSSFGGSTVNLGTSTPSSVEGVVYAQNGKKDTINCYGSPATIYADQGIDVLNNCPNVKYTHPSLDNRRLAKHRRLKRVRHHTKRAAARH